MHVEDPDALPSTPQPAHDVPKKNQNNSLQLQKQQKLLNKELVLSATGSDAAFKATAACICVC